MRAVVLVASSITAVLGVSSAWPGPYSVKTKQTWDYKGPCGPGTIYYPDSSENFPLLSFAHGIGASGTKVTYSYTNYALASWGYIIIALEGCESSATEYKAQEAMMDWAFSHWDTIDHSHPGGVFGHSMGGGSTIAVAGDGNACSHYGLQGAFMMHPCNFQVGKYGASWIPSLYTSGSLDPVCSPGAVYADYKHGSANGKPRGFGVYKGYTHTSPCGPLYNIEVIDMANWFGCYLYYNQDSCSSIYNGWCGDGKKVATGQKNGCELFMDGDDSANSEPFETLWPAALATGDPLQALAVPWGHHNGTWAGFMNEIKTRGEWSVQQRKAYLSARGLYPKSTNVSELMVV